MTTPVAILRAPTEFHMPKSHHHQHHNHNHVHQNQMMNGLGKLNNVNQQTAKTTTNLNSTPTGNHIFGTTPGGTNKIVYSREQLLLLASSPLSQTNPPPVPQEISRSPEQKPDGFVHQNNPSIKSQQIQHSTINRTSPRSNTNGSSTVRNPSPPWTTVGSKSGNGRKNENKPLNTNIAQYGRSAGRSPSANFNVGSIGSAGMTNTFARSPPNSASKPRSPGNAFNFGKHGQQATNTTPSSFKERLEAAEAAVAKQQINNTDEEEDSNVSTENLKRGRLGSNSSTSTNSIGNNHHENDEQFAMEM